MVGRRDDRTRRAELVGLRWSDVDLARGQLSVAQQRAQGCRHSERGPHEDEAVAAAARA
jgi:integrase